MIFRLFKTLYVMYVLPEEVSVKEFKGRLKSPPKIMLPELKLSSSFTRR